MMAVNGGSQSQPMAQAQPAVAQASPDAGPQFVPGPQSFRDVAALFDRKREAILYTLLVNDAHLVRFEPGRIELRPAPTAPRDFTNRVGSMLSEWTGQRWIVSVSQDRGEPTLAEQTAQRKSNDMAEAATHPFVRAALQMFPGAKIVAVKTAAAAPTLDAPSVAEGFDGEVPLSDEAPAFDTPDFDGAPPPDEGAYGGDMMPDFDGDDRP
jgi:DNA polymerase-3 subunit gamma/tau